MRVAEEEDRRLVIAVSDCCFRFVVDVERLSTKKGGGKTNKGGGVYTRGLTKEEGLWGSHEVVKSSERA